MTNALVISNILLWLALIALGFVVMALTRQIGLLHERLAPVGALAQQRGPEVGEAAGLGCTDGDGRGQEGLRGPDAANQHQLPGAVGGVEVF